MARYLVELFGDFAARDKDGGLVDLSARKAQALLVFLLLSESRQAAREQLLGLLWPEAEDGRARASLRKAISALRAAFGSDALIQNGRDKLSINPDVVESDVSRLFRLIDAADWSAATAALPDDAPLAFWRAPTPEFEDWSQHKVRNGVERLVATLDSAAEAAAASGEHDAAGRLAEAGLRLDPLNEDLARKGIVGFARAQNPTQAEAVYRRLQKSLDQELGIKPSDAIARIFAEETDAVLAARRDARQRAYKAGAAGVPTVAAAPALAVSMREPSLDVQAGPARYERPAVIIRPLKNLSPGDDYGYLGVALAEDLIVRLAKNRWLQVVADEMPGTYKPPIVFTNPETGARNAYVVNGSYLATANGIRLTVRVSDEHGRTEIWGKRYDQAISDLLAIQDDLSKRLAAEIEPEVLRAEQNFSADYADSDEDLDAWLSIMRARHLFWRTRKSNNAEAAALLEDVLKREPNEVSALVTLAFAHLLDLWSCWTADPSASLERCGRAARKAVQIATEDPWTHFTLGTFHAAAGNLEEADHTLAHALSLHPTFAAARGEYARVQLFRGRLVEAERHAREAFFASPNDPHASLSLNTLGLAALFSGDGETAFNWAMKAVSNNSYWFHHQLLLSLTYWRLGDRRAAEEKFRSVMKMVPTLTPSGLAHSHPFAPPSLREAYFGPLREMGLSD